jgi:voltage-gated potassium channel Kch
MSASPFSVIDPLPVTFARELHVARRQDFVRPVTKLYNPETHGEFAYEAIKRLARGEVIIAHDAAIYEENLLNKLRYDTAAATALFSLRHAK